MFYHRWSGVDSVRWHGTIVTAALLLLPLLGGRYIAAQALQRSVGVVLRWHCATTVHAVRHYAICAADAPPGMYGVKKQLLTQSFLWNINHHGN
jgi:hypothetical protein